MQWVKNPALSVQWPGLLLGYRFSPWPGDFHMLLVWPLKKKKGEGELGCQESDSLNIVSKMMEAYPVRFSLFSQKVRF